MNVFDLDRSIVETYARFARSFTRIRSEDLRAQIDQVYESGRFWPEPMIQLNPSFKAADSVGQLIQKGLLNAGMERIFRDHTSQDGSLCLRQHQVDAVALSHERRSFVVTTGTGSGKSLCYFIPIVNAVIAAKSTSEKRKTRAIVIYPMNALANSQLSEINNRLLGSGYDTSIVCKRMTGQESEAEREAIRSSPPDIMLTNFMMLEMLLTRQNQLDRDIIANCEGLEFLVLDELHTYRGRQGADVAMLVRRIRERLGASTLQCIGTSATMASEGDKESKKAQVAKVASTLFATKVDSSAVVTESLVRVTDHAMPLHEIGKAKLAAAIRNFDPVNAPNSKLCIDPFMVWIEMRLGLKVVANGAELERATPQDLEEAARNLALDSGLDINEARSRLETALEATSRPEDERGGPGKRAFFPVRLHRFLSGAGRVFATLEPVGARTVNFDGQLFEPSRSGDVRLYPTYFCRECGQEHHPVREVSASGETRYVARAIDDVSESDDGSDGDQQADGAEVLGFLTPIVDGSDWTFTGDATQYPDDWIEETRRDGWRLKSSHASKVLSKIRVAADGSVSPGGVEAWFQRAKFSFCARCGASHTGSARDINRLAGLTAEGRSSATTILVSATLKWMKSPGNGRAEIRRKILAFSDNRQDAALQAGHFNDFVFVTLLRGAVLAALQETNGRGATDADIGQRIFEALGFAQRSRWAEWLPQSDIEHSYMEMAAANLRNVLAHRFWFDQRRGWRYTFPNLEQLGLVSVEYRGLAALCQQDGKFSDDLSPLADLKPEQRVEAFTALLNAARTGLAIRTDSLDAANLEALFRQRAQLAPPWGFADTEQPRASATLTVGALPQSRLARYSSGFISTGPQSLIGRKLRKIVSDAVKGEVYRKLVRAMARKLVSIGLFDETPIAQSEPGYRLAPGLVVFQASEPTDGANSYFAELYQSIASSLIKGGGLLFGDEAREHTAQVDQRRRELREYRFRYGDNERAKLGEFRAELQEAREPNRFLPVMFCSPTMELGVDIAELDAVYLRNVPPSPANYAQRSGRAGRGGAAALVLTYCSAQGPHDQYYFNRRAEMIQGVVRPPSIDLSSQELIESHMNAVWLAETKTPLSGRISEVLDTNSDSNLVRPEIHDSLSAEEVEVRASRRISSVLEALSLELQPAPEWLDKPTELSAGIASAALERFTAAFDRWRTLLAAAKSQLAEARRVIDNMGQTDPMRREAAERLQRQAQDQINLLLAGSDSIGSDFYTYRYLATEGFLPGYNFPRLPLMAFIPGHGVGKKSSVVSRPRFLGISEFGPHSRIYHEGRAYRVVRAQIPASELAQGGGRLATHSVWRCANCGARHAQERESCKACGDRSNFQVLRNVKRIENVAGQPSEHITANDEERQRQGFEIVTSFEWPAHKGGASVRIAEVHGEDGGCIAALTYAGAATIQRLNLGLRRRRAPDQIQGFMIEPSTGRWLRTDADENQGDDPTNEQPQRIVPMVEDRKNALFFSPRPILESAVAATVVHHALLRGIETEFQLEDGEILADPMPDRRDRRGYLLYEASEGGAGVLNRLLREPDALARVARRALSLMHFEPRNAKWSVETILDRASAECKKGCYRCLLSYFNQPDHEQIDRHDRLALEFLCALAQGSTQIQAATLQAEAETNDLPAIDRFMLAITERGLPSPKKKMSGKGWQLTWPADQVVALFGSTSMDRQTLVELDYKVFAASEDEHKWQGVLDEVAAALGGN